MNSTRRFVIDRSELACVVVGELVRAQLNRIQKLSKAFKREDFIIIHNFKDSRLKAEVDNLIVCDIVNVI